MLHAYELWRMLQLIFFFRIAKQLGYEFLLSDKLELEKLLALDRRDRNKRDARVSRVSDRNQFALLILGAWEVELKEGM